MSGRDHRGTIFVEDAELLSQQEYPGRQFVIRLRAPKCAAAATPGSFAHLTCDPQINEPALVGGSSSGSPGVVSLDHSTDVLTVGEPAQIYWTDAYNGVWHIANREVASVEALSKGELPTFLMLLAVLNFFVGVFNLLPLLPLDGGHIAIAWFEKVRSFLFARLGRPDPGRVDYMKLMPVTYAVILIFGGFTLLTVAADIVNPITLVP